MRPTVIRPHLGGAPRPWVPAGTGSRRSSPETLQREGAESWHSRLTSALPRRRFGDASWTTRHAQQGHHFPVNRFPNHHGHQPFRPLPAPVGLPPYHLALESVIPLDAKADTLVFHIVGDSVGYLRMEVTATTLKGECYTVPGYTDPAQAQGTLFDSFTLDITTRKVTTNL